MGDDGCQRKLKEGGNRSLYGIPIIPAYPLKNSSLEAIGLLQNSPIGYHGPTYTNIYHQTRPRKWVWLMLTEFEEKKRRKQQSVLLWDSNHTSAGQSNFIISPCFRWMRNKALCKIYLMVPRVPLPPILTHKVSTQVSSPMAISCRFSKINWQWKSPQILYMPLFVESSPNISPQ